MPLANDLRPQSLDDIIGQQHLIGDKKPIRKMAEKGVLQSMLLFGPAGIGKTTIARCLAHDANYRFRSLNASSARLADIRKIIKSAKESDKKTIVHIDEIHRWAKNVQDSLLEDVENGTITLIGTTTEKPVFAVNAPLLSRLHPFELYHLSHEDMTHAAIKVIKHYKNNGKSISIDKDAIIKLIKRCDGDVRRLITTMETIIEILMDEDRGIDVNLIDVMMPNKYFHFTKNGNEHYDYAAAWQNSVQKSDVDQAIYFLALWLASGEDPVYIGRRIMISASEDACLNPNAAIIANNAYIAAKEIGMPECAILLSHATIEIANSTRDKVACNAIQEAMNDVNNSSNVINLGEMHAGNHDGYMKIVNKKYVKYQK